MRDPVHHNGAADPRSAGAPGRVEIDRPAAPGEAAGETVPAGRVARRWGLFLLIGLLVYLALYAWSEWLVYQHGEKNRFFMVATTPPTEFDYVILGASHAMPLGFAEMNELLEAESGAQVMNLSIEGGGILPARFLLDYFLTRHRAGNVLIVVDSFAYASPQWNEDRLDPSLFQRAPLDPALVRTMWRHAWARDQILPSISGFAKINNQDRFAPDLPESELTRFDRVYRPVAQIDRQRVSFLYPAELDPDIRARYFAALEELIAEAQARGMNVVAIKPPTPPRYRDNLPDEAGFDAAIGALFDEAGVTFRDFSEAVTADEYFYDTDHLNRAGTELFIRDFLADFLGEESASSVRGG